MQPLEWRDAFALPMRGVAYVRIRLARRLAVAVFAAAAAIVPVAAAQPKQGPLPLDVFVIAGQSNAAGYGHMPAKPETADPRVLDLLHPDGARAALDPLFGMGYRQPGIGPGRFFGLYVVHHVKVRVGLIDCAVGGSELNSWLPGTPARPSFLDQCVQFARLVLHRHPVARLSGVIFSQGETDGERQTWASAWAARFAVFAGALRADLGTPKLPIVMQRTLDFSDAGLPFTPEVRAQQARAAAAVADVALVDADGLPHDGEHFTAAGYSVLGGRMAEAWLRLTGHAVP